MDTASEKLEHIHHLWKELERTKPDTSESEALIEKIRVLSGEYRALAKRPEAAAKAR
jgi:hypothetical protein